MKTYRMVANTNHGDVAIDIVLRGTKDGIAEAEIPVRKFLDFDCGFAGAWVDQGTERETYTVAQHKPVETRV